MWDFCIMHILSKWIQLQYRDKDYSNLRSFNVNQLGRTLRDMALELVLIMFKILMSYFLRLKVIEFY
jgi:hypothetical protein